METVIIVGGGLVGVTLALALSHLSQGRLNIELVETHLQGGQQHPGSDVRTIALAQGTCQQLVKMNIWQALADGATAIECIEVSDRGHAGFVTLRAEEYNIPALGQVIELYQAGQKLFNLLAHAAGIRLHCPATVVAVRREQQRVDVTLDNGQILTGKLLIAADGGTSLLARACGVSWRSQSYDQIAVVTNVVTEQPHRNRAFERFTAQGPLALLPISGGRSAVVWCCHSKHQSEMQSWCDEDFLQHLQRLFGWRLGRITQTGLRQSYPLQLRVADRHISHRLALVGNAAQRLHPIAGQGFNLGVRDVMALAQTVVTAYQQGEDLGSYRVLDRYQQHRQSDQRKMINFTDGLIHLFANHYAPLIVARQLGLLLMDRQPGLREILVQRTLGRAGR